MRFVLEMTESFVVVGGNKPRQEVRCQGTVRLNAGFTSIKHTLTEQRESSRQLFPARTKVCRDHALFPLCPSSAMADGSGETS